MFVTFFLIVLKNKSKFQKNPFSKFSNENDCLKTYLEDKIILKTYFKYFYLFLRIILKDNYINVKYD